LGSVESEIGKIVFLFLLLRKNRRRSQSGRKKYSGKSSKFDSCHAPEHKPKRTDPTGARHRVSGARSTLSALDLGLIGWPSARPPRFHLNAHPVCTATLSAATAAPPACPAGNLANISTSRLVMGQSLGHAVQNQRWPTPVSRDTSNPARPISRVHRPGRALRGLGSKASVLPRQGPPSRRTRRRRGLRVGIPSRSHLRTPPAPSHPSMRIAATAARCLPKLVAADAHVLPSAHGLRISIRCVTADPDGGRRLGRTLPQWALSVRRTHRRGSGPPGARSILRPQAVEIRRLGHLGWARMRGVASVHRQNAQSLAACQ
jgi:hypothetical protein